jgi:ketosteroid isomerase-like protein
VESSSSPDSESIALIKRGIEAWNTRDWDAAVEAIHPDVVWETSGVLPGFENVYYGHEGVRRFWDDWVWSWEELQIEIEGFVERSDDDVLLLARFRARGRDGLEIDQPVAFEFITANGLMTQFKAFWNRDDMPLDARTTSSDSG